MLKTKFLFFPLISLAALPAAAASRTWDGGDASTNLTAASNWSPNAVPLAGDSLFFPDGIAALDRTVNNNFPPNTEFASLSFNGAGYTFGGTILKLSGGMAANAPGGVTAFNGSVAWIEQGFISANYGADLRFGPSSQLYVSPGLSGNLAASDDSTITVEGLLSVSGGLFLNGNGRITLRGAKSVNGPVYIWCDEVEIDHAQSLGPGSVNEVTVEKTLRLVSDAPQTVLKPLAFGSNIIDPVPVEPSQLYSSGAVHTFSGDIAFRGSNPKIIEVASDSLTLGGALRTMPASSGVIIKRGTGTLRLNGAEANTFSNILRVEEGQLELSKPPGHGPAVSGAAFQVGNSDGMPNTARAMLLQPGQLGNTPLLTVYNDGRLHMTSGPEQVDDFQIEAPALVTMVNEGTSLTVTGDVRVTGDPGVAAASLDGEIRHSAGTHEWNIGEFRDGGELFCTADLEATAPGARIRFTGDGDMELYSETNLERITLEGPGQVLGAIVGYDTTDFHMEGGRLNASIGVRDLICTGGILDPGDGVKHSMLHCNNFDLQFPALYRYSLESAPQHQYDAIYASDGVTLGFPLFTVITPPNIAVNPGDEFFLVHNTSDTPVSGQFSGQPEGSLYLTNFYVSYHGGNGNDVSLTWIIPPTGVTRIWDGGGVDNNWMTPANWSVNVAPEPGDALLFPVAAQRKTNMNNFPAGTVFQSITIGSGDYHISGSGVMLNDKLHFAHGSGTPVWSAPLTFALPGSIDATSAGAIVSGPVDLGNNPTTLRKDDGPGELVFSGAITGILYSSLHKKGPGTVNLAAACDFHGGTYVEEGRLTASHNDALNPTLGWTYVNEGAEVRLDGAGVALNVTDTIILSGTFSVAAGPACVKNGPIVPAGPNAVIRTEGDLLLTGALDGEGMIHKTGAGVLTLGDHAINQVQGGLLIDAGEVRLAMLMPNAAQSSPVVIGGAGQPARLTLTSFHQLGDDVEVRVHPSGTFDAGAFSDTLGALTMTAGSVTGTGAAPLILKSGQLTTHASAVPAVITARLATAAGVTGIFTIADGAASPDLSLQSRLYGTLFEKTGAGRVDFTVSQPVEAFDSLDLQQGSALFFNNSQFTNVLLNGGTLGGNGTVGGIKAVAGGIISPGAGPGALGGYKATWNAATNVSMELNGLSPGAEYDQYFANDTLELGGAKLSLAAGFDPAPGAEFMIVRNVSGSPVTGTFVNAPEGGYVSAPGAKVFQITYAGGDGDDVVLTRIDPAAPEITGYSVSPGADPNDGQSEVHAGVKGTPGLTYVLESSPDLVTWTPEDSGTADLLTGLLSFDFLEPDNTPRLFHRARLP